MALTEGLVRDTYSKLKKKAARYLEKGNVQKGLLYTHLAASTNYGFWLSYSDEEIESLAKQASKLISKRDYDFPDVVSGRCVMLDSLARYRGGLTVQYINAIVSAGWDLLYITMQEMQAPHHVELYNYLRKQRSIRIIEIPSKIKGIKRLQFVYDSILNFCPDKVFLHCTTSDSLFPAVSYALPSVIKKYFIDVADHGFRIGMNSCDYTIEFRDLGCSIAAQQLSFAKDKILKLPFYPVVDQLPFKGLPKACDGKVKILSGGIFWKIVDKEDTFFRLCKKILQQNPEAIILYPGGGDPSYVKGKLNEYEMEDKFLLLGWRDDISELFRNSDIFLNTYPHGGGTMSQYAANARIPILSYRPLGPCPNPVEYFVCQVRQTEVSSNGEEEFLQEANRLIKDVDYRIKKAERIYSCILGKELFNQYFKDMIVSGESILPFNSDTSVCIPCDSMEKKIQINNKTGEYQMRLVSLAGLNSITLRHQFLFPFLRTIVPKLLRVFKERGFHFNKI